MTTVDPARRPLLAGHDAHSVIAWRRGEPVTAAAFLADVAAQAAQLPAEGALVNLCSDRYDFAIGLAAALSRGHASLLPPNARADTLARLRRGHPALYVLGNEALSLADVPVLRATGRCTTTLPAAPFEVPQLAARGAAITLLTSGSTGMPVPHAKQWDRMVQNIQAEAACLAGHLGRDDLTGLAILATVPPQHSYGLESSVLLALLGGCAFEASRPYFPADIAETLVRLPRPRALVTTPFHLKTLLAADIALPPVDLVLCATAPLSPQLAAEAETRLQGRLVEIYGCTEAGQVAARRTTAGPRWQTLGELRIHAEAGEGGAERYVVQGGHVAEPTALADILDLDDARHFRLLGRANDLIHVAGKRSSLGHLDHHLNSIPGVADGAFWMPEEHADGIVRPVAFVVAPALTASQVIAALRERLEAVFVPRRVVHVDRLPREATGKLTQQSLQQLAHRLLRAEPTRPDRVTLQRHVPADHPAFDGHFAGAPVLPGVVLLNEALQAARAQPHWLQRLGPQPVLVEGKFLAPVPPGAWLQINLRQDGAVLRFEIRHDERTVASGRWSLQADPAAPAA